MCVRESSLALLSFWVGLDRRGIGVIFRPISALVFLSNETNFIKFVSENCVKQPIHRGFPEVLVSSLVSLKS